MPLTSPEQKRMWAMNTKSTENRAKTWSTAEELALLPVPKLRREFRSLERRIERMTRAVRRGVVPPDAEAILELVEHLTTLRKELSHRFWNAVSSELDGTVTGLEAEDARDGQDLADKSKEELVLESIELNERDQALWKALNEEIEQTGDVPANLRAILSESLSYADAIVARHREFSRSCVAASVTY